MANSAMDIKTENIEFDVDAVRQLFPSLSQKVHGRNLAFLDSAASAQKPQAVIDAMSNVYQEHYANIHRGVYKFAQETTVKYEAARVKIASFLGARTEKEIVFTRNATEAINLVAATWGRTNLKSGDEVILSSLEHHANIVPWTMLKEEKGINIKVIPLLDDGALDLEAFKGLLTDKTKMVSVTHMSNVLGTVVPVKDIIQISKTYNSDIKVLIDGSQAAVHFPINVKDLDCDFYVITGHKIYGPSGIGVLYGKYDLLDQMPPYQGGGEMIETVHFDKVTFKGPPYRFEAGTPAIVEAIGLGAAVDFINQFDRDVVHEYETALLSYAKSGLSSIEGVTVYDGGENQSGAVSFTMEGAHPHDIGTILDQVGVAVRAGHHCAQPLMEALGVSATVRCSLGIYSTQEDIDQFLEGLQKAHDLLIE